MVVCKVSSVSRSVDLNDDNEVDAVRKDVSMDVEMQRLMKSSVGVDRVPGDRDKEGDGSDEVTDSSRDTSPSR